MTNSYSVGNSHSLSTDKLQSKMCMQKGNKPKSSTWLWVIIKTKWYYLRHSEGNIFNPVLKLPSGTKNINLMTGFIPCLFPINSVFLLELNYNLSNLDEIQARDCAKIN